QRGHLSPRAAPAAVLPEAGLRQRAAAGGGGSGAARAVGAGAREPYGRASGNRGAGDDRGGARAGRVNAGRAGRGRSLWGPEASSRNGSTSWMWTTTRSRPPSRDITPSTC